MMKIPGRLNNCRILYIVVAARINFHLPGKRNAVADVQSFALRTVIIRDEKSILPVSSMMYGEYGIEDVVLSISKYL